MCKRQGAVIMQSNVYSGRALIFIFSAESPCKIGLAFIDKENDDEELEIL